MNQTRLKLKRLKKVSIHSISKESKREIFEGYSQMRISKGFFDQLKKNTTFCSEKFEFLVKYTRKF